MTTQLMIAAAAALLVCAAGVAPAQTGKRHRIVFEVTSAAPEQWEAVLNNLENIQRAFGAGTSDIVVAAHGKGLGLLLGTNTAIQERMQGLAREGVTFAACENTMKRMKVAKDQLLAFAATVDSGVAEVVRKQEAGWSYIRSGS